MNIGQVVYSKKGHDKTKMFVVVKTEQDYSYLVDGNLRPVLKPKKKKNKHIQITNTILDDIVIKIENDNLADSDIKKALKKLMSEP